MPLRLIPPRKGKTPYFSVRGTYLGRYVDRSAKTSDRALAKKVLKRIEREIESGEFTVFGEPTFAGAAAAYMKAGGERRFVKALLLHFGDRPLRAINQAAIDDAATVIYPNATAATRNRQVHTPISAILKHAGADHKLRRPMGAAGQQRTRWLWPEEAERFFQAAEEIDAEFHIFLVTLCYTGLRLSEGLGLRIGDVRLTENFAHLARSKNDEPRAVYLAPVVVAALAAHPRGMDRPGDRLFRFRKNGHLYTLLRRTKAKAGNDLGWVGFHTFCHTWATWMRRYGGLDTRGLVGTGRWKDQKSAARYEHVVVTEESRKAMLLPTPKPRAK